MKAKTKKIPLQISIVCSAFLFSGILSANPKDSAALSTNRSSTAPLLQDFYSSDQGWNFDVRLLRLEPEYGNCPSGFVSVSNGTRRYIVNQKAVVGYYAGGKLVKTDVVDYAHFNTKGDSDWSDHCWKYDTRTVTRTHSYNPGAEGDHDSAGFIPGSTNVNNTYTVKQRRKMIGPNDNGRYDYTAWEDYGNDMRFEWNTKWEGHNHPTKETCSLPPGSSVKSYHFLYEGGRPITKIYCLGP